MDQLKNFSKGFFKENAVFVLLLGLCPTLGVTTSAFNGLGMGLATTFVLLMSNIVVSLIKRFIPDKVRIPSFIVIIASFVTIVELVMQAYVPDLFTALGLFIPLIVVNCLVLGRAEAFASKNNLVTSAIDGMGMGLGFTMALTVLGAVREILGAGSIFGWKFIAGDGMIVFVLAPGAFLVLGYLIVIVNKINKKGA
jgi:electron transport complex protein RnfE